MARLLRGYRAAWLKLKTDTDYTLLGVRQDDLSIENNEDVESGKDVTGAAYVNVKGYNPETSLSYIADSSDSIYEALEAINNGLLTDDAHIQFEMIVGTFTDEIAKIGGAIEDLKSQFAYKTDCIVTVTSSGGDTSGYHLETTIRETGGRTTGYIKVTHGTGEPAFQTTPFT